MDYRCKKTGWHRVREDTAGYPLAKCYIYGIGTDTGTEAGLKLLKQAIEADCDDLEEEKALLAKKRQQRDCSQ